MKGHLQLLEVCLRRVSANLKMILLVSTTAFAGQFVSLTNAPPTNVSSPILLTGGGVIFQGVQSGGRGTGVWYKLSPDINGNYRNGTWTQIASFPPGYTPLFYASAVLPDGRVIVEGGEYNGSGGPVWTNKGAIYDPIANTWTSVSPPVGWSSIGDAQSTVLPNGTFMLANALSSAQALLDPINLTWTIVGNGKADWNNEEGWTLLPNGDVLTVDVNQFNSELFSPSTEVWSTAGVPPVTLVSACSEIGPGMLRPDGTVLWFGGTGRTATYAPSTGSWTVGPTMPNGYVAEDVPAALLPNGNILIAMGQPETFPDCGHTSGNPPQHTWFYMLNGTSYTFEGGPTNNYPVENRLLVLPSGNALWTRDSTDVELYIPNNSNYLTSWQPTISSYPGAVTRGTKNYNIFGTQFNGLSQAGMYGDDYQAATNYPLVRIQNKPTGHISYCRTHNHGTMAVATGSATVSTQFDIPANAEAGASKLFL